MSAFDQFLELVFVNSKMKLPLEDSSRARDGATGPYFSFHAASKFTCKRT